MLEKDEQRMGFQITVGRNRRMFDFFIIDNYIRRGQSAGAASHIFKLAQGYEPYRLGEDSWLISLKQFNVLKQEHDDGVKSYYFKDDITRLAPKHETFSYIANKK